MYLSNNNSFWQYQITNKIKNYRADIIDVDGRFIAKSVITYNIGVKPLNGIQYKSYNRKDLKFFE